MREIKRYLSRNWIWIVIGLILTIVSVKLAYIERGYLSYGGEWLILPLNLTVIQVVRNIKDVVKELSEAKDE